MTRLTEQYLLNYLQKKSLTMAAARELGEASSVLRYSERPNQPVAPDRLWLQKLRKGHALAIENKCRMDEAAAFDAYMTHLQEMAGGGS
jgi:hypothetical protein